jgi:hypothetical protein
MAQIELVGGPHDGQTFWSGRLPQEWSAPVRGGDRRQIAQYTLERYNESEGTATYMFEKIYSPGELQA